MKKSEILRKARELTVVKGFKITKGWFKFFKKRFNYKELLI